MLVDVFNEIKNKSSSLVSSNSGSQFEEEIKDLLKACGFTQKLIKFKSAGDLDKRFSEYIASIKGSIQSKSGNTLLDNAIATESQSFTNFFIAQPYGKQDFPDFLVGTEHKIYSIEAKFTSQNAYKPVWNGNLPKKDAIYIFGSFTKRETIFFRGEDILPEEERILILNSWIEIDKDFNDWIQKYKQEHQDGTFENRYGFLPYVRKAYQQSQTINPNATLDFFGNSEKTVLEDKVIDFITNTDC